MFYESYLELGGTNMVSIISIDSKSISYMLDDKFADLFQEEFPIFYKNRFKKSNFRGAKDSLD